MNFINLDGRILPADQPALMAGNRGYRYGDGIFETMKMTREKISLGHLHFDRFFAGIQLLGLNIPGLLTESALSTQVMELCRKNNCSQLARVRLSAFSGNGSLFDNDRSLHYLVEAWPMEHSINQLNENGLIIDIYPDARKAFDSFSHLKSANGHPYVMGAQYAKTRQLNDCLILNADDRIAEATIANIFLVHQYSIQTPPLSEACVAGVMRRYLLDKFHEEGSGLHVEEKPVNVEDLFNAKEVFLSNAIQGIRWVKQFRDKTYQHAAISGIYERYVRTIWP